MTKAGHWPGTAVSLSQAAEQAAGICSRQQLHRPTVAARASFGPLSVSIASAPSIVIRLMRIQPRPSIHGCTVGDRADFHNIVLPEPKCGEKIYARRLFLSSRTPASGRDPAATPGKDFR